MNTPIDPVDVLAVFDADIHSRLVKAFEKRERAYLWTPSDTITFIPRVLAQAYGDGRALFAFSTVNQRPAYWIIRACSQTDFREFTDDILTDLEEEFGSGRCSYSGNSLFHSRRERMRFCKCEDCSERGVARWPMVDGDGGCCWGQMRWPKGFQTEDCGHILARIGQPS